MDVFPLINILLQVLATLPASVATAERTFSTLKRIKTWLRTTLNEDRLIGLALQATHRDIKMNPDQVIDRFAMSGKDRLKFVLYIQCNALVDYESIADSQGDKNLILYCQVWGNSGVAGNEQTSEARLNKCLWSLTYRSLNSRNFPIPSPYLFCTNARRNDVAVPSMWENMFPDLLSEVREHTVGLIGYCMLLKAPYLLGFRLGGREHLERLECVRGVVGPPAETPPPCRRRTPCWGAPPPTLACLRLSLSLGGVPFREKIGVTFSKVAFAGCRLRSKQRRVVNGCKTVNKICTLERIISLIGNSNYHTPKPGEVASVQRKAW
ncbi:hypothetical protein PR048_026714 [Dryococelus australis]|uniref:HAT C-terminal dimerisation domain-containing protein n=1 Tax=Dryococelus australis TaxID=614101 RepID=A0ABQ9GM56_9NEOP|nr:hypothetical protein PR048_026714 [Dryococelus australis]